MTPEYSSLRYSIVLRAESTNTILQSESFIGFGTTPHFHRVA